MLTEYASMRASLILQPMAAVHNRMTEQKIELLQAVHNVQIYKANAKCREHHKNHEQFDHKNINKVLLRQNQEKRILMGHFWIERSKNS